MCIFAVRLPFLRARLIFLFTVFFFTQFRKFQSQATTTQCRSFAFLVSCRVTRLLRARIYSMHKYSIEQKEEKRHFYGIHISLVDPSNPNEYLSLEIYMCVCVCRSMSVCMNGVWHKHIHLRIFMYVYVCTMIQCHKNCKSFKYNATTDRADDDLFLCNDFLRLQ